MPKFRDSLQKKIVSTYWAFTKKFVLAILLDWLEKEHKLNKQAIYVTSFVPQYYIEIMAYKINHVQE